VAIGIEVSGHRRGHARGRKHVQESELVRRDAGVSGEVGRTVATDDKPLTLAVAPLELERGHLGGDPATQLPDAEEPASGFDPQHERLEREPVE
jgi:hypothetical protein